MIDAASQPAHATLRSQADDKPDAPRPATAAPARVLYVVSDLSVGGAEVVLYTLLAAADRARFEPGVVTLADGGALRRRVEALGVEVHSLGVRPALPTPLDLWRLVRLVNRLRPDVIVGWMYHSCLAAQLASLFARRRAPVLWSIHYAADTLAEEKPRTALVIRACALLSRLPAHVVFVSRAGLAKHAELGFKAENGSVVPNGVDVETFAPSPEARASVRAELGLPPDALLVGAFGRYHPMKDHANFLRAAALVSREHRRAHFLLAGRGVDEKNRELRRLVRELGLDCRAHLLGERHDIPRLAASLDIFTLPSLYGESFPMVVGEAMACAVPCVVTDVGDAAHIVGDTGLVVPPRSPRALAEAWAALIALGDAGRASLGRAASARVRETFPVGLMARRYESLYEAALGSAPRPARLSRAAGALEYRVAEVRGTDCHRD